jgi:hydroxyacylglutathione hydrolase
MLNGARPKVTLTVCGVNAMAGLQIHQFLCRSDNFGVLIHDAENDLTAAIDTPEAGPIRAALAEKGWRLTHILTTHHHADHIAGHKELKSETGCRVIGARKDAGSIPGIDQEVAEGDEFAFGDQRVRVLETPGHTLGHVSYYLPDAGVVFVGDTLFSLGCGRLMGSNAADMMWASLQKLMALPGGTLVYCGHEYTKNNAAFALTIEPGNAALQARAKKVDALRAENMLTLPVSLADELAQNPFLRPDSPEIQEKIGKVGQSLATIFAEIRRLKDRF